MKMDLYKVQPRARVKLRDWDPNDQEAFNGDKEAGKKRVLSLNDELEELQELLFAEHEHKVLVVLQGIDTAGKDGTIRHVFDGVNPQGVRVASYKKPTEEELDHDYLWRVHKNTPKKGEIVIFNRSHYEDVLVVRVHNLVDEQTWRRRYDQINHFERMLVEEGTIVLKFFLYIDKNEQKERLQARLDDPTKHWKFSLGDLEERKLWQIYIRAYEEMLSKTSTEWAPWYIIPSNRKWYRNIVIGEILVRTLKDLNMKFPEPVDDLTSVVIE